MVAMVEQVSPVIVPWNEERVRKIARQIAFRKKGLFNSIAGRYQQQDLVDEAVSAAKEAWPNFDPWKGNAATFIYNCAENHLIDLQRRGESESEREKDAFQAIFTDREGAVPHDLPYRRLDTSIPVATWLLGLCLAAKRAYAGPEHTIRRSYAKWQMIGFGALMARMKLSPRCARFTLLHRPDLRRILLVSKERVPSKDTLWRAYKTFEGCGRPDATPPKDGISGSVETPSESENAHPVATEL